MIRVERAAEPARFDEEVRAPGSRWLAKNKSTEMPAYWRRVARELGEAFADRCGYTAMWLSAPGTVDHFVSRDEDRSLAYEWSNLRYASATINSKKSSLRSTEVLDPHEVEDGWFELILPQCELIVTERCPAEYRARAETMLVRLGLGKGEQVVRYRQEWYRLYEEGDITLDALERKAPLIARAIRKAAAR